MGHNTRKPNVVHNWLHASFSVYAKWKLQLDQLLNNALGADWHRTHSLHIPRLAGVSLKRLKGMIAASIKCIQILRREVSKNKSHKKYQIKLIQKLFFFQIKGICDWQPFKDSTQLLVDNLRFFKECFSTIDSATEPRFVDFITTISQNDIVFRAIVAVLPPNYILFFV